MTVKDSFNVRGLHTTWGNPQFRDYVADSDATVVERLRQAGAIIVGKDQRALHARRYGQTANDLYGVTSNPWDTSRTPGGSSGGGAAALAAAMTFLEYGSDLVGSIRVPASFCGVYGLKPSAGIVPLAGFQPPGTPAGPSAMTYLNAVGPLGRSAADLRHRAGRDGRPGRPGGQGLLVALAPRGTPGYRTSASASCSTTSARPVTSEVGALLAGTVDALAQAGVKIVEGWPEGVDPVADYESFGYHVQLFFAFHQPGQDPGPVSEFISQEHRRMAARAAWGRYFDDIDVFLCPSTFTVAFPHDGRPFEQRTIATPEGERRYDDCRSGSRTPRCRAARRGRADRDDGGRLPAGAQIVGPLYEDDTALAFAGLLGRVTGGYQAPPI